MKTSDRTTLKGYYWNHDAIRKDMDRLKTVTDNFSKYSPADFTRISKWFDYHKKCILYHHHGEDDFFFPIMRERKPQFKIELDNMEHEHFLLDEGLEKLQGIFAELSGGKQGLQDSFTAAAVDYGNLVISHLEQEEAIVETVVADIPVPELLNTEGEYRNRMTRSEMATVMPWIVDAMDEKDRKFFFSMVPLFVKWIYRLSAKPKFSKLVNF